MKTLYSTIQPRPLHQRHEFFASSMHTAGRRTRPKRGFTLIELLTVIAIIGILSAILIPTVSTVRDKARSVRCLSNVRQIALAGYLYAQDEGVYPGWGSGKDRKELLFPYLHSGRSNSDTDGDQVWLCPSNIQSEREASYGFNTVLNWQPFESIEEPSATVAVADAGIKDSLQPTLATHLMPPSTMTNGSLARPNPRHGAGGQLSVNVGFIDGHAESLAMQPPFYPDIPGKWFGNGITNPKDPAYADHLWDLE